MKRGYSDRLAELEVRLMNQERSTGSGNDVVNYARERRKMFSKIPYTGSFFYKIDGIFYFIFNIILCGNSS